MGDWSPDVRLRIRAVAIGKCAHFRRVGSVDRVCCPNSLGRTDLIWIGPAIGRASWRERRCSSKGTAYQLRADSGTSDEIKGPPLYDTTLARLLADRIDISEHAPVGFIAHFF